MNLTDTIKRHKPLFITLCCFGVIYCLISLVNHYNFRTYALDLGLYTNALYDYTHFQFNDSATFKMVQENLLADHFDIYLILFSPLSLIFGTYTLLLVQIFAILTGGIGIYKFFLEDNPKVALPATIFFFMFFGVFSALSFDYHSNVVAAALIPWLFYQVKKENLLFATLFFLLIIISKENISLWLCFISIGLAFENRKRKRVRNLLLLSATFSALYFVIITKMVMPSLSNDNIFPHFNYSALGASYSEAIKYLLLHPIESFVTLFSNHIDNPVFNGVKGETYLFLILSGLPVLFLKPQYIIMLLPIFFQKMFHDNPMMWSVGGHYNIEFAPILAIGVFSIIDKFRGRLFTLAVSLTLIGTVAASIRLMDNTVIYTNKACIQVYKASHYKRDYDVRTVHHLLNEIPDNAVVSAQSPFLPHLALRDDIYNFPIIKDAEYIVFSDQESPYPLQDSAFIQLKQNLIHSSDWKIDVQEGGFYILERRR